MSALANTHVIGCVAPECSHAVECKCRKSFLVDGSSFLLDRRDNTGDVPQGDALLASAYAYTSMCPTVEGRIVAPRKSLMSSTLFGYISLINAYLIAVFPLLRSGQF